MLCLRQPFGGLPEDDGGGDLLGFLLGELAAPGDAGCGGGACTVVVVLQVAGRLLTLLFPVMPTGRNDVATQFTVHEQGVAIVTPRTTQVDLVNSLGSGKTAVVENIAVGLVLGSGGGSDV